MGFWRRGEGCGEEMMCFLTVPWFCRTVCWGSDGFAMAVGVRLSGCAVSIALHWGRVLASTPGT